MKAERAELRAQLLDAGEELAAQLLDYHDRERKPVWWAYFDRIEMTAEELVEDPEAIGGLTPVGEPVRVDRSWAFTLSFPPQEHKIGEGQQTVDRATLKSPGAITGVEREARRLTLKRGRSFEDVDLPEAIVPKSAYNTPEQEAALMRLGRSLLAGDRRYPALESILRREPFPAPVQTSDLERMQELVLGLDGRHLVIQGPPGSGKTWTSGRLIAHLLANGKTVGVASTSHKAIHNLLDAVVEAAGELGIAFDGRKKASHGNPESYYDAPEIEDVEDNDECIGAELAAGTAWLFSRENQEVDYLFVDEAGQVSLADALAMGTAARNVVLVGDPQQLDQVIQGTHPSGSGASVLRHLLGDDATVPPDRGLFLERTYRLHPDICGYISEEFYEGRLEPAEVARGRTTPLGTGLRYLAVEHEGHRQESRGGGGGRARRGRAAARGRDRGRDRRLALQRAGERAPGGAARHPRRHRGQVPGAGGGRRPLLDGELERRGRPARARVPALAQPAERGDLAGALPRLPRLLAAAARGQLHARSRRCGSRTRSAASSSSPSRPRPEGLAWQGRMWHKSPWCPRFA